MRACSANFNNIDDSRPIPGCFGQAMVYFMYTNIHIFISFFLMHCFDQYIALITFLF